MAEPKRVRDARSEELQFVKKTPVYKKVFRCEAEEQGCKIIKVRWVDTNKGTAEEPNIRSRLIAMEFKVKGIGAGGVSDMELYASTPPLEAPRSVVSYAASHWKYGKKKAAHGPGH